MELDSSAEINKIARNILIDSKAAGKFPTPVDTIIAYTELSLASGVDLSKVDLSFLSASKDFFGRLSRKVLGMIDIRQKTIYLDHSQKQNRKNFVKLHEVGHGVLPWQSALLGCKDDETTISPEIDEIYESEASYFASSCLFQLDRFNEESAKLPLSIASARVLSEKFGGSLQATLRRYVEFSPHRCSMLVFHRPEFNGSCKAKVRNYFESLPFTKETGGLAWPEECGMEFPFVHDMSRKRKLHETGKLSTTTSKLEALDLEYHYFDNTFNVFILMLLPGEKNASRVTIVADCKSEFRTCE